MVEIDKIVISESITENLVSKGRPSTTVEIESTTSPSNSVADVVGKTSGVHVQHYGGLEESTAVSIRGSQSSQVQVLLDGVPLQTASSEGVGLSQISSEGLSKIEIYKSFLPLEFGTSMIGGVVNLTSKPVEPGWHHRYGFGMGSFLTLDGLAEIEHGGEKNDVNLGINFRRTQGDFTFLDNNGTPLNLSDDQVVKRQNNEHQSIHPHMKWTHRFDERTKLTFANHVFRMDGGVPGLQSYQSQTANRDLTEWLSHLKLERSGLFRDRVDLTNNLYGRVIKSQFSDPNGEIGLGAAQDNDNLTFVLGDRFVWETHVSENILIKKGLEYVGEWFLPKDFAAADPKGSISERHQINVSVEPHFYFFHQKLLVSSQVQSQNAFYHINDDDPSLPTFGTYSSDRTENPMTAVFSVQYSPVKNLLFKSSMGRVVRLPQFVEMFGDQGYVLGNPQLTSEKSFKYDAGIFWQKKLTSFFNHLSLETDFFDIRTNDLIQFELASGLARASNIGEARVWGFEVVADLKFLDHFELSQNYTFQRPKDEAVYPGNFLVGRPEYEWNAELSFHVKGLTTSLGLNFVDNLYLDSLNTQKINTRLVAHFNANYLIRKRYRVSFEARNLNNSQVVDAVGFPLPGRSFFGRVDVIF